MNCDKKNLLLYAVTDRSWLGTESLYSQVKKAIDGGVTFVQLREKELAQEAFYKEALEIQKLCRNYKVPFVINDNVELAKKIGADGVHVGQSDMEALDVRKVLGDDKIIGVSAQTVEQAELAEEHGADYLGVGAVFPTGSKDDATEVSFETLKEICEHVHIPVIAIGGITKKTDKEDVRRIRMIKGAIFDIDGTLIDSMEMWEHAAERYLAGMGIEAEPHLQKKLYTFTITESAEYLKKNYSLSKTILEIIDGINETIGAFYRNEAEPKPGIIEFLSALQERKIPMTVATATDRVHIEAVLKHNHMDHFFKKILTCSEVGIGKEHPDIYIQAAKYMQTNIADTWVFEDAYHGARTAFDAGFKVCGIYDAASAEHINELKKYSTLYVDNTKELYNIFFL